MGPSQAVPTKDVWLRSSGLWQDSTADNVVSFGPCHPVKEPFLLLQLGLWPKWWATQIEAAPK